MVCSLRNEVCDILAWTMPSALDVSPKWCCNLLKRKSAGIYHTLQFEVQSYFNFLPKLEIYWQQFDYSVAALSDLNAPGYQSFSTFYNPKARQMMRPTEKTSGYQSRLNHYIFRWQPESWDKSVCCYHLISPRQCLGRHRRVKALATLAASTRASIHSGLGTWLGDHIWVEVHQFVHQLFYANLKVSWGCWCSDCIMSMFIVSVFTLPGLKSVALAAMVAMTVEVQGFHQIDAARRSKQGIDGWGKTTGQQMWDGQKKSKSLFHSKTEGWHFFTYFMQKGFTNHFILLACNPVSIIKSPSLLSFSLCFADSSG